MMIRMITADMYILEAARTCQGHCPVHLVGHLDNGADPSLDITAWLSEKGTRQAPGRTHPSSMGVEFSDGGALGSVDLPNDLLHFHRTTYLATKPA